MAFLINCIQPRGLSEIRWVSRLPWLLLLASLLGFAQPLRSAEPAVSSEYQVKAVLLFNLTQFVEWPETAFASSNSPVRIGILGKDPFGRIIDEVVRGEKLNNRPIEVTRYSKIEAVQKCHILFVSGSEQKNFEKIITQMQHEPVLTVADDEDFTSHGGMVSLFRNADHRIRLKINPDIVKTNGLSVSSKLLRLADIVQRQ